MSCRLLMFTGVASGIVCGVVTWGLAGAARADSTAPEVPLETAPKYLMLDSRVIDTTDNARLVLGTVQKDPRNPLFGEDKPWEPRFDNLYPNVTFDEQEGIYKCWYSPFITDKATVTATDEIKSKMTYCQRLSEVNERSSALCYAMSRDGIAWQKPDLGITEHNGSTSNNLVKLLVHGVGIVNDPRDPDPNRRFKMFCKDGGISVCFSPDGVHWSELVDCPEINVAGDTHNNAFWDERSGRYVGITRRWRDGYRVVARTESPDFVNWEEAKDIFRGIELPRHVYAMPVFRYANVYLGLATILDTRTDMVDCELAWSPDTVHWQHVAPGKPLIPRGPEGTYDSGCIYAAAYPVIREGQIRIYYGGGDGAHCSWRKGYFCLARLRPDGFAGYEPVDPEATATIVTQSIPCIGNQLTVSADASGGSLRVAVLGSDDLELDLCRTIADDVTDHAVTWKSNADLATFQGQSVRLKFELKRARLYAFGFGPSE